MPIISAVRKMVMPRSTRWRRRSVEASGLLPERESVTVAIV